MLLTPSVGAQSAPSSTQPAGALQQLSADFWEWRAAEQPFSFDDIPRLDRPQGWAEQHRAVYEALRSGDSAAAGAFSRAHLVSVLHGLAEVLSDEPGLTDRVARMVRLAGDSEPPADLTHDGRPVAQPDLRGDPPAGDTLTVLKAPQEASDVDRH